MKTICKIWPAIVELIILIGVIVLIMKNITFNDYLGEVDVKTIKCWYVTDGPHNPHGDWYFYTFNYTNLEGEYVKVSYKITPGHIRVPKDAVQSIGSQSSERAKQLYEGKYYGPTKAASVFFIVILAIVSVIVGAWIICFAFDYLYASHSYFTPYNQFKAQIYDKLAITDENLNSIKQEIKHFAGYE